jgi:RNA polymerase sigma-70 factor, ECF subfamily
MRGGRERWANLPGPQGGPHVIESDQSTVWLTEARRGNSRALAKLLATLHPQLRARVETRLDPDLKARLDPDDVLQEVYVRVFRHIDQFEERGPGSFLGWVIAILDNKLLDVRRAAHCQARDVARERPDRRRDSDDSYWSLLDQLHADSGTPSRVVRRQEALTALLASLDELSESYRDIIEWRFLDGLGVAEVAARLGKTEGAVAALTQRALHALRDAFSRRGEFTRGI